MNLEVDVMDGDELLTTNGLVIQRRENKWRLISAFCPVGDQWEHMPYPGEDHKPLSNYIFTRYCEGCGLTVKHIKPEPKVETIKPPEWVVVKDGEYHFFDSEDSATRHSNLSRAMGWSRPPQRIDWGAK